jgi:hypothetical protein
MDRESLIAKLRGTGYHVDKIVRTVDDDGWRLALANGAVIHCFDDGRCTVHGEHASILRLILRSKALGAAPAETAPGRFATGFR